MRRRFAFGQNRLKAAASDACAIRIAHGAIRVIKRPVTGGEIGDGDFCPGARRLAR
jgi:hypothetical protein